MGEGLWQFITKLRRNTHEEGRLQVQTFFIFFFQKLKSFSTSCVSLSRQKGMKIFIWGLFFENFDSKVSNSLANQQHQEEVQLFSRYAET